MNKPHVSTPRTPLQGPVPARWPAEGLPAKPTGGHRDERCPPGRQNPPPQGARQRSPLFITTGQRGRDPSTPRNGHRPWPGGGAARGWGETGMAASFYLRFWRGSGPDPTRGAPSPSPSRQREGSGTAAAPPEPGSGRHCPPPAAPAAPYLCRCPRAARRPSQQQSCEAGARRPPSPSSAAPACQRGRSEAASRGAGAWGGRAGSGGGRPRHRGSLTRPCAAGTCEGPIGCDSIRR